MPYKDQKKQREAHREAQKRYRQRVSRKAGDTISDTRDTISDTVNPVYFKYGSRDLGKIYDTCKEEFHRDIEEQAKLMEVLADGNR